MSTATTPDVLKLLSTGLWHTTSEARFHEIVRSGSVLPDPPIADSERWKTHLGPDGYPFVRKLGGVSLFDFRAFDPALYERDYPLSSWHEFVPFRQSWGRSIWLQVDAEGVLANLVGGRDLVARWKADGAYRHSIMPLIECAHIGPIPTGRLRRAVLVGKDVDGIQEMALV